ncbi:hypothetical protein BOX15_Mlig029922g5, partial [Macrostomum lignano]
NVAVTMLSAIGSVTNRLHAMAVSLSSWGSSRPFIQSRYNPSNASSLATISNSASTNEEDDDSLGPLEEASVDLEFLVYKLRQLPELSDVGERAAAERELRRLLPRQYRRFREKLSPGLRGYTLLQYAVQSRSELLVDVLLDAGADINASAAECSAPLHTACRLGCLPLFRLLLARGARVDIASAGCFPLPHGAQDDDEEDGDSDADVEGRDTCRRVSHTFGGGVSILGIGLGGKSACRCRDRPQLPVELLLESDQSDWLELLLDEPLATAWQQQMSMQSLFIAACRAGAFNCARLLLSRAASVSDRLPEPTPTFAMPAFPGFSGQQSRPSVQEIRLNEPDEDGLTPLMHAAVSSFDLFSLLLQSGASVSQLSARDECVLHVLFRNLSRVDRMVDKVRLALGSGLEEIIDQQDTDGNTVLHHLVSHVNNNVRYIDFDSVLVIARLGDASARQQAEYQRDVLDCMRLVLSHNCNPRLANDKGDTPFGQLLSSFYTFLTFNVEPNFADPLSYLYVFDMSVLAQSMDMLLAAGSCPNEPILSGQMPIKVLLNGILNISPIQYEELRPGFMSALRCLCERGARVNFQMKNDQGNCTSLVAALAENILNMGTPVGIGPLVHNDEAKRLNVQFLDETLRLLLSHGLRLNERSRRTGSLPFMHGGRGHALSEFLSLARVVDDITDVRYISKWVLTLIQAGADPNLEPYSAEPTIVHSQSSIYLRSCSTQPLNLFLHQCRESGCRLLHGPHAWRLLTLLFHCTQQPLADRIVSDFVAKMKREDPRFLRLSEIQALGQRPRSLRQLCRLRLHRRLMETAKEAVPYQQAVRSLPLPYQLVNYMLFFQPWDA